MQPISDSGHGRLQARPAHYSRAAASFILLLLLGPAASLAQEPSFTREVEARVFALVNDLRAAHGLARVEREARLDDAAGYLAGYMANTERLEHRADGSSPAARVKQRGYVHCNLSENIAMEYSSRGFTPEALARNFVEGWRDSPSHRENMLDRAVTENGLGVARNARGEYYAAQLFARPAIPGAKKGQACPR